MFNKIGGTVFGESEDRAVSPVIGVVLMVAITVILAAVIATFVMGMGDSLGDNPQAAVDIDTVDENTVTISLTDLGNSDGVVVVDSNGDVAAESGDTHSGQPTLTSTGESLEVTNDDGASGDEYVIDGSGSYTVQAYFGDSPSNEGDGGDDDEVTNIDEQVDASAVISEFDLADSS